LSRQAQFNHCSFLPARNKKPPLFAMVNNGGFFMFERAVNSCGAFLYVSRFKLRGRLVFLLLVGFSAAYPAKARKVTRLLPPANNGY
jgi:hypothetical protein